MSMPPDIDIEDLVQEMAAQLPEASAWKIYRHCAPRLRFAAMIDGVQVRIHVTKVRHAHFFRRNGNRAIWIGASQGELQLRVTSSNYTPETYGSLCGALMGVQIAHGMLNRWRFTAFDREELDLMHKWGRRDRRDRHAALEALKIRFYGQAEVPWDKHQRLVAMLNDYSKWRRGIRLKERPRKIPQEREPFGSRCSFWPPPLIAATRPQRSPAPMPAPTPTPTPGTDPDPGKDAEAEAEAEAEHDRPPSPKCDA